MVRFQRKIYFWNENKNWIELTKQMAKIWEKIWMRTYCKLLLLPFKCDSQSRPDNQMIWEMSSHCDKNSAHNVGGKYRWIPLMWRYFSYHLVFLAQIVTHIWRAKAKVCSTFAFNFFLKFWTVYWSIQSSFTYSYWKYDFFVSSDFNLTIKISSLAILIKG